VALELNQLRIQWLEETPSPEREADHSPPFSAQVKNVGAVPQLLFGFRETLENSCAAGQLAASQEEHGSM
jgi:hypothetical protein